MSRLINKISDLGYYRFAYNMFKKRFNSSQIIISIDEDDKTIRDYYVKSFVISKGDLMDSEQAFNVMQKDLEILKECEK